MKIGEKTFTVWIKGRTMKVYQCGITKQNNDKTEHDNHVADIARDFKITQPLHGTETMMTTVK